MMEPAGRRWAEADVMFLILAGAFPVLPTWVPPAGGATAARHPATPSFGLPVAAVPGGVPAVLVRRLYVVSSSLFLFFRRQISCVFIEDTGRALRKLQTCPCVLEEGPNIA